MAFVSQFHELHVEEVLLFSVLLLDVMHHKHTSLLLFTSINAFYLHPKKE